MSSPFSVDVALCHRVTLRILFKLILFVIMAMRQTIVHDESELLCYCDGAGPDGIGIGREAWLNAVREHPQLDFYQLCSQLQVGQRCTACLLDAEALFDQVARSRPAARSSGGMSQAAAATVKAEQKNEALSWRARLYSTIDRFLPNLPATHVLCVPVFRGRDIRTVLTLSNCYPALIGKQSAPYRYGVKTLDASGNILCRRNVQIEAGKSEDIDLTDDLDEPKDEGYSTGSCWIAMKPTARGSSGSTRPHFKLVGSGGISAVHAQSKSPTHGRQMLIRGGPQEHHLIHMVNLDDKVNSYAVRIRSPEAGAIREEIFGDLPPRGATLVELPALAGCETYLAETQSQGSWRYHYMIADPGFTRMSADHGGA